MRLCECFLEACVWLKPGDHPLTLAFLYFTTLYAIAAFHP
jgi:hypothetical protein